MGVAWRLAASATVGLAATALVVGTAPAAATPVPPDDTSGTAFLRATGEQAAAEWFAANVPGGVTQVACARPPADEGGVQFLCYAVDAAGAVVVARATVNDYGTPELAAVAAGAATATTVAVVDSATTAVYTGTGSQTVPVDPVPSLMLAAITVSGSGPVSVQPVHASAPVGPSIVGTAPLQGRYLIGSAGLFSSLTVTADGDWTIRIQRPSSAIALGLGTPASGVQPDVVSYTEAVPTALVLDAPTAAAITVSALSAAGPVTVLEQPGPYSGPITVPDGPGFLAVDIAGPWTISAAAATPTTTSSP